MGSFGRFSLISCLTTTTTTHTHSLSLPGLSHCMYHCNIIYINISSHHPTTATLVATLRSTRPLNPDDDPDDDTASHAYMQCNATMHSPRHASSDGAAHTCLTHTHTKFLRNLILRLFHVSPFPCLCLSVFVSRGIFFKKENHPSLPSSL